MGAGQRHEIQAEFLVKMFRLVCLPLIDSHIVIHGAVIHIIPFWLVKKTLIASYFTTTEYAAVLMLSCTVICM